MEKTKSKGFTLIEMLAVMLIISVLAVTAYFKWSSYAINLDVQVTQLANDIRYTQNLSMSQSKNFRLAVLSSNTYQIQDASGTPIPKPLSNNVTVTLVQGITFGTLTGITSKITFNNQGIPYADSSTTPLATTAIIPLIANGKTRNVSIYPITGRVTP